MLKLKRSLILLILIASSLIVFSCKTVDKPSEFAEPDIFDEENLAFLESKPESNEEVYRVVISSTEYSVKQHYHNDFIVREKDDFGDEYIMSQLKNLDKINEVREGLITVWLYPDSGRIMQARFEKSTFIREIDKIVIDDIQRWTFKFPRNTIHPNKFSVRYRIVLRQRLSDEEIMQEIREGDIF